MDKVKVQRTYVILGALLRQHRNAAGMAQDDLATELGIDRKHISRIESGIKPVSVARLLELCRTLETDCGNLISELEERLNNES